MVRPIAEAGEHGRHLINYRSDLDGPNAVTLIYAILFNAFPRLTTDN